MSSYKNTSLFDLNNEQRLTYYRNKRLLSSLAYDAYLSLTESHPYQAAWYFNLSYQLRFIKAIAKIGRAREGGAEANLKKNELEGSAKKLFIRGLNYYLGINREPNRANAILLFKEAAKLENADAQFYLGTMFENGCGVDMNPAKAFKLYRRAAKKGNVLAQCYLANLYEEGNGVDESPKKAYSWYRLAAEQGDPVALFNLGEMYQYEDGDDSNSKKAVVMYRLAAEQGDPVALFNLGEMYQYGEGVDKKYLKKACACYRLAAEQGELDSLMALTHLKEAHPIAAYHLAMIEVDYGAMEKLIDGKPSVLQYFLSELKHFRGNELQGDTIHLMINHLLSKSQSIKKWGDDGAKFVIQYLSYQIINNELDLTKISIISDLDISSMSQVTQKTFINLISDIWYYTKTCPEAEVHVQFTSQAAVILSNSIRYLDVVGAQIDDNNLHLCTLILIKNQYGLEYEVSYTESLSFDVLLAFLALCRLNKSPQEMNDALNLNLVQPVQFSKPEVLLNQLMSYLDIKQVTKNAPILQALKRKLAEDWEIISEPSEQKALLVLRNICQECKKALKANNKNPNGLFAIKLDHAKELFTLLAEGRFYEVFEGSNFIQTENKHITNQIEIEIDRV